MGFRVVGLVVGWILVLATPYLRAKLGRSNSAPAALHTQLS